MTNVDPELVRALVRRHLERRLGTRPGRIEAYQWVVVEGPPGCEDAPDFARPAPCLIEPERPCYNSGYCKKLGH